MMAMKRGKQEEKQGGGRKGGGQSRKDIEDNSSFKITSKSLK